MLPRVGNARLWWQKWRWYERNALPWNRARIHREFARRRAFARWPLHGNVLEAFREGRLEIGEHTLLEPHVWLTAPERARIRIGSGSFLNLGVMVAAVELVEIGEHCMFANGCFITDGDHRFDDPDEPVPWQGFTTQGADARRRQRLVRRQRGGDQRRDDRRALRDRREQRGHRGHPRVLDRGGGARAGAASRSTTPTGLRSAHDDQVERAVELRCRCRRSGCGRPRRSRSTPSELTVIWLSGGGAEALASPIVAK